MYDSFFKNFVDEFSATTALSRLLNVCAHQTVPANSLLDQWIRVVEEFFDVRIPISVRIEVAAGCVGI